MSTDNNDDLLDELLNAISSEDMPVEEALLKQEDVILGPLLPEINLLEDQCIRLFTRAVLLYAPDHFWTERSSTSHHPPDERLGFGNVLHTQRVVRIADLMCFSQERTSLERDMILSACILHDITKYVQWEDGSLHYDNMHPYTASQLIHNLRGLDEENPTKGGSSTIYVDELILYQIAKMIRCHLGPFSAVPETFPSVTGEWIVHLADNIASNLHHIVDAEDNMKPERWQF